MTTHTGVRSDVLAQAKAYGEHARKYRDLEMKTLALARPGLIQVWFDRRFYTYSVEPGSVAVGDRVTIRGGKLRGEILRVERVGSYYDGATESAKLYARYGCKAT